MSAWLSSLCFERTNVDWGKASTVMALVTGFSKKIGFYLMLMTILENLGIACDTLRNMDFEQNIKRDRCFKPDKLDKP
jgi:hypothetical protein